MARVLADTHAIIWYLSGSSSLSQKARTALDSAVQSVDLYLSAITLVEMRYLVEKGSIAQSELARLGNLLNVPNSPLVLVSLDQDIARALIHIPRTLVPDMPDRIIAATAYHLRVPVVTHDHRITNSPVSTIW